jgi:hypothetical protein
VIAITNPLDCLKQRWQRSRTSQKFPAFVSEILRTEGLFRGLWLHGLATNCLACALSVGCRMGLYPHSAGCTLPLSHRLSRCHVCIWSCRWSTSSGSRVSQPHGAPEAMFHSCTATSPIVSPLRARAPPRAALADASTVNMERFVELCSGFKKKQKNTTTIRF